MPLPKNTAPFVAGAAIGIAAVAVLSFANNWIVTTSKMEVEMHNANVTTQAEICAAKANIFLTETNSTEDLTGYQGDANARRTALARAHTIVLADNDSSTETIVNACAGILNKARS